MKVYTKEDVGYNFDKIKRVLNEYGVKDEVSKDEFLEPNAVGLLLFATHLFKILPNFLPRSKIEFNCALHETVKKEI